MTERVTQQIETGGGAVVEGGVTAGRDFIGRDNITIANHGLLIIQQTVGEIATVRPGVVDLGANERAAVKLLQQGKLLHTFLLSQAQLGHGEGLVGFSVAPDVAVLVDINRRILLDVAHYLDQQSIAASLILVTNDREYGAASTFLDVQRPAVWADLVQEFNAAVSSIKRYIGAAKFHFFLAAPLPLAFGLGAVWGTVDEAIVYHYEEKTYHPVLTISRKLRQAPTN